MLLPVGYILWTQASIKAEFSDGKRLVDTYTSITNKHVVIHRSRSTGTSIPTIRVALNPSTSQWHSIDNRRLFLYKLIYTQEMSIPVHAKAWDLEFSNKLSGSGLRIGIDDRHNTLNSLHTHINNCGFVWRVNNRRIQFGPQ